MTPKEKAQDLFDKYFTQIRMPSDCEGCMQCVDRCNNMVYVAKKYALIAVDEILHELDHTPILDDDYCEWKMNYWQEVKEEIEAI